MTEPTPTIHGGTLRIDTHHHAVPRWYVEAAQRVGVHGGGGMPFPTWEPERSLEFMDRLGIGAAVLSVSAPGVYFGEHRGGLALARALARRSNEHLADVVADHAPRFGALATLPLPDVDAALAELSYAFDDLGLDGVVLLSNYAGSYLADPAFEEVFAELDRRRAVAFVHPAEVPGSGAAAGVPAAAYALEFPFDTTRAVAGLLDRGALERHRRIRFLLSHAGGTIPYLSWRLAGSIALADAGASNGGRLAEARRLLTLKRGLDHNLRLLQGLYYDTALSATPHALPALRAFAHPSHVVFGTDFPWADASVARIGARGLEGRGGFDRRERKGIERRNALDLFPRLNAQLEDETRSGPVRGQRTWTPTRLLQAVKR